MRIGIIGPSKMEYLDEINKKNKEILIFLAREVADSKWFKPKPIYIIRELVSGELPREANLSLKLIYISYKDLAMVLK
jgi:hypothetical protein